MRERVDDAILAPKKLDEHTESDNNGLSLPDSAAGFGGRRHTPSLYSLAKFYSFTGRPWQQVPK
jgi:hypothetical protein